MAARAGFGRPAARALLGRSAALAAIAYVMVAEEPAVSLPGRLLLGATVLIAAGLSLVLAPPMGNRWRAGGVVRLALAFALGSLRGGLDAAARALHPRLPLWPAIQHHRVDLPEGRGRVLLSSLLSLMPGTLAVGWEGSVLRVHVLDDRADTERALSQLEALVGAAIGVGAAGEPR